MNLTGAIDDEIFHLTEFLTRPILDVHSDDCTGAIRHPLVEARIGSGLPAGIDVYALPAHFDIDLGRGHRYR